MWSAHAAPAAIQPTDDVHSEGEPPEPRPIEFSVARGAMIDEHFKGPLEVRLVQHQQPVKTFRADGAHESLCDPVGLGRAKRRTNDLNPLTSEHLVKPVGEFLIAIANQKPHRFRALGHGPGQLPSLLNDPWRVRIRRATGHMHAAAAQLDEKEDVEPYMDSSRWSNER